MKVHAILSLSTVLLFTSCSAPREVGQRYEAERDLLRTYREVRRLSVRPDLGSESQWTELAHRFEAIAARYDTPAVSDTSSARGRAIRQTREVAARALVLAAQVYSARGDSIHPLGLYERVASQYSDLPQVTGEVLLASGRIAEARRHWEQAIDAYRGVIERIEPATGKPGAAGSVLPLPLQVARLHAKLDSATPETITAAYQDAQEKYERWIAESAGSDVELEARVHLANVASDQGDWQTAVTILRDVESRVRPSSRRDPAGIRLAVAAMEARADPGSDASISTLLSVPRDYPKSPVAPQALLALAGVAAKKNNTEDALAYVERLRSEYPDAHESLAQALLIRARVLEQLARWPEALETLRSLPVEAPLSDAALQAPLEIYAHYSRAQDEAGMADALSKAETYYRDFMTRYPPGRFTVSARAKLAQTLTLQKRYDEAVSLLIETGELLHASGSGAVFMVQAAQIAVRNLEDPKRAAGILQRTAELYPNTETGRWASAEALRLQEGSVR